MTSPNTVTPAADAQTQTTSLRWLLQDALTMMSRNLLHWRQDPATRLINWFFPVLTVLMFGSLFGGAMKVPGSGSYYAFLMAGIFTLTMLFGLESTVLAVVTDTGSGLTDRLRTLPIRGFSVLLGRALADLCDAAVGLFVLVVAGRLLGWQWHLGLPNAMTAFLLLLLLRFSFLWLGIFLGLGLKTPQAAVPVQILVWPIGFLSSIFVDPSTMPHWLGLLAMWNPLSATASAARSLFGNPVFPASAQSFVHQHAVLLATLWPLLILCIFVPLAVRRFRRLAV